MIVALSTASCQSQPCRAHRRCPIEHLVDAELFQIGSAFTIAQRITQETSPHLLRNRGIGNEIPRQLLNGKFIEGKIIVERINDPLPISPCHGPQEILQVSVTVSVVRQIQPPSRPSLTKMF